MYLTVFFLYCPSLDLTLTWRDNICSIATIIALTIGCVWVTQCVWCFFFACDEDQRKNLSTLIINDDNALEQIFEDNQKLSCRKTMLITFITYLYFGFMVFALFGFAMVYEEYATVFLITYLCNQGVDCILLDLLWSVIVAIGSYKRKEEPNCLIRFMIQFTRDRSGA